jgi:hypothetical protein
MLCASLAEGILLKSYLTMPITTPITHSAHVPYDLSYWKDVPGM